MEEFSDRFSSFQDQICILEERPSGKIRLSKECIRFWEFKGFNQKPGTFPSFYFIFTERFVTTRILRKKFY
ncbi:hypothetical protein LEP1GSC170_5775 [Leptospira interrogans serovar Bataviae str. HAI135]|nr:hypothetical protein LEP1GSC170_5775 [Leptospira interrogans serovar Bataviae str. HAI135]